MADSLVRFYDDMTLAEARDLLGTMVAEGVTCPCCSQYAKVYKRKLNRTMVRALAEIARAPRTENFVHGPTVLGGKEGGTAGELGKLAYFELVEEMNAQREDG